MDVQELEKNADIRIKFASINDLGGYSADAHEEYLSLFPQEQGELDDEWVYIKVDKLIDTRFEHTRRAWVLRHVPTQTEIAAMEHETGIELLIPIVGPFAAKVAAGVATAAIVGLAKWAWGKWSELRANKGKPGFVRERVTARFGDGKIERLERLELRPPLDSIYRTVDSLIDESFT